jgi:hypothetical protein
MKVQGRQGYLQVKVDVRFGIIVWVQSDGSQDICNQILDLEPYWVEHIDTRGTIWNKESSGQ